MSGDQRPPDSSKQLTDRLAVDFALQAAGLGIWEVSITTDQIVWDDRCRAFFGLAQANQLPYREAIQYIHPQDRDRVDQAVQWALNPQSGGTYDQTYRTLGVDDGQLRWVRFLGQAYFTPAGKLCRFSGIAQEVTQQVFEQQQLVESEARFRSLIEEAPVATCLLVGRTLRVEIANEAMLGFWGKDASILGESLERALPELVGQRFLAVLDEVFTTGQTYTAHSMRADLVIEGVLSTLYFDFTYKPLRDPNGNIYAILNMATDVTQQVLARQALEESERFARTLFEHSPVAKAVFVGQDMVIRTANQNMLTMWGKDPSVIGQPFMVAMPELVPTPELERLRHVLNTGESFYQGEEKFDLLRYGMPYTGYYDYRYEALRSAEGVIYGVISVASEVTHQVRARQKIETNEQLLRNLVLGAPIGICILNADDLVIETVNDAFIEVAGKPYEQLINQHYWVPFAEAAPYYADALSRVAQEGKPFSINEVELMLIRHNQPERGYVTFFYMPLNDSAGKVEKVVVWVVENTHQVTERRRVEALVQQRTEELASAIEELSATNEELITNNEAYAAINEELAEANALLKRSNENLEQFAYVASHDLQEPLRKIQQFGDLLKTRLAGVNDEERSYLERMQSAAARMSVLIRDLLEFSRIATQRDTNAPVALNLEVEEVATDLELILAETQARLEVGALPIVEGDRRQLRQLFQNLLSNALKFRRPGVTPHIQIKSRQVAAARLPPLLKPARTALTYYQIDVIDNGIGFNDKYVDRIFQVFQRLHGKNQYAGTGIGLAICEKVATNHGGAITATSQPGQGATFSVFLPD
jgi:signal transduction histidine kinase